MKVSDVYECASSCNNGDVTPCNSFEYCPGANLCSLSKSHANEGTIITSTAGCDFYASMLHRGSYISAHVLWNLLNMLRK